MVRLTKLIGSKRLKNIPYIFIHNSIIHTKHQNCTFITKLLYTLFHWSSGNIKNTTLG